MSLEYVIHVKHVPKDGKWCALVEMPDGDALVVEDRLLGKTLAKATLRIEEVRR